MSSIKIEPHQRRYADSEFYKLVPVHSEVQYGWCSVWGYDEAKVAGIGVSLPCRAGT